MGQITSAYETALLKLRDRRMQRRNRVPRSKRRVLLQLERLESRQLLNVDWRNPVDALDADQDGFVVPLDALKIINDLNTNGSRRLPLSHDPLQPYLDVTGDEFVAPIDVLYIINHLNTEGSGLRQLKVGREFADETDVTITLGQPFGSREYRVRIDATFDTRTPTGALGDLLAVYLVGATEANEPLMDQGPPGSALFTLSADQADYLPGAIAWDGSLLSIDLSSIEGIDTGLLRFQLLSGSANSTSRVTVKPLSNTFDTIESQLISFPRLDTLTTAASALDFDSLLPAADIEVISQDVGFSSGSGRFVATLHLKNNGAAVGRQVAVTFPGLPAGATLKNPSGISANGAAYVNFESAIARGGLAGGAISDSITVELDDPLLLPFLFRPAVFASVNHAPSFGAVAPLTISPGGTLTVPWNATDSDGDPLTFSLSAPTELPNTEMKSDGTLVIQPTISQIGVYQFDVIASDGTASTQQTVTLNVVADPLSTTRISGRVLDVGGQALAGMMVEVGGVQGLTQGDGRFSLDLGSGPIVSDTLKVRGDLLSAPAVYPFIAEKFPLLLEHPLYPGVNNVIVRPIYLPALDVANGKTIDPQQETIVTTAAIPGISVSVAAGTLLDQRGSPFTGILSITEVPTALTPAALPPNLVPDLVVTIQPGEMVFASPAPIVFPNRSSWPAGTLMDLWSINPTTGEFDDVGDMRVSADGATIETISGGIRNSSWHFVVPPPPAPVPPTALPTNQKKGCEAKFSCGGATSEVELHSGAIIESHTLVAYESLGRVRGLELTYHSQRADPRPIVHLQYDNAVPDPALRLAASLSFERGPISQQVPGNPTGRYGLPGGEHFWSVTSAQFDVALQGDLRTQPSGRYAYEWTSGLLRLADETLTGSTTVVGGSVIHVNSIGSQFGSGWGLSGLHELVNNPDGSVLLIDGDGSELLFEPPALAGQAFVSPPGDFSLLTRLGDGTFRRTLRDQTLFAFDSANRLASVSDRNGNTTRYQYDASGKLKTIIDPAGLETRLQSAGGHITSITDPAGRVTNLAYDVSGNLIRITNPDGSQRTWDYDNDHHIVAEVDERGNREETSYHFSGRAIAGQRKDGSVVQFAPVQIRGLYPAEETLDAVHAAATFQPIRAAATYADANGNGRIIEVDQTGQLLKTVDALGSGPTLVRDSSNQVSRVTDARSNPINYKYDVDGNLRSIRDGLSSVPVYVMPSGDTVNDNKILDALTRAGTDPTLGVLRNAWDGTQADLSQFQAVFMVSPGFSSMALAGQTALIDFVQAGGAFITTEDAGYNVAVSAGTGDPQFTLLENILPVTAIADHNFSPTTYTQVTPDPLLNAGLPAEFTFFSKEVPLTAKPGATLYYSSSNGGAAVVGWDRGAGRVMSLATDLVFGSFITPEIDDPHVQILIGNAVEWATRGRGQSVASFEYDPLFNQVASQRDGLGHLTLMDIDPANGNTRSITRVVGALGGSDDVITRFTYTPSGLVDTVTDPLGRITDSDYDAIGRLVKVTEAKGTAEEATRRFEYDAAGNMSASIDELGNRRSYFYDTMNRLVKVVKADPDSAGPLAAPEFRYAYDARGNVVTETDARGNVTRFEYDALDRIVRTVDAGGGTTTAAYDRQGNLVSSTDEVGQTTRYLYDSRQRRIATIDPNGGQTSFTYDADNNLLSVIDPMRNITSYEYDQRGRLINETDPLRNSTLYAYDAADNLRMRIDRNGRRIERTYDALNRISGEKWFSSATTQSTQNPIVYTYDKASNLLSVGDFFSTLTYQYDNRSRIISVDNLGTQQVPRVVLNYSYDATGNVLTVGESIAGVAGAVTAYSYDTLHQVTRQQQSGGGTSPKRVDLRYDAQGQITSIDRYADLSATLPVVRSEYTYDSLNRMTRSSDRRGSTLVDFEELTFDAAHRIKRIASFDGTLDYQYDSRNQLRAADGGDHITGTHEFYVFDTVGNRVFSSEHGLGYRTGTGNRLLSDGTYSYQYDNEGNITKRIETATGKALTYLYDTRNRLTLVRDLDATGNIIQQTSFRYDAFNRRIYEDLLVRGTGSAGGFNVALHHYVYDRDHVLLAFKDNYDNVSGPHPAQFEQRLLSGPLVDQVFAQDSGGGNVQWLLWDHLGSTRDLVDNTGVVLNHLVYDSFGEVKSQTNPAASTRYLYAGREFNADVDLYYYRARYYDPALGRFLSEDPIGFGGGDVNRYRYVGNNPLNHIDPLGLASEAVWVEGPSGNEPEGHLSISVGDPNAGYASYSYAKNGNSIGLNENGPHFAGVVYADSDKGGDIYRGMYRTLSPEEANALRNILNKTLGESGDYTGSNTCRTFSLKVFQAIEEKGIGKAAPIPNRIAFQRDANGRPLNASEYVPGTQKSAYPKGLSRALITIYGGD